MCMKYRAICFDFDYTLGDSTDSIVGGFQYAFERMGLPIPDRDTVRGTVGYLLEDAYEMLTGDSDKEHRAQFRAYFLEVARPRQVEETTLFPGTAELLQGLHSRSVRLGIVSTKTGETISRIMERFGLRDTLEIILGSYDVTHHKPHPEGILKALDQMGVAPEELLYCGDTILAHIDRRVVIFLLLERHKQRVIRQPFTVLFSEDGNFLTHFRCHAAVCLAEQRPARIGELLEVRRIGRSGKVAGAHLIRRQQTVLCEQVHVDQIRVARRRREALVRRVAEAGMTERQHLPVGLVRVREEVDEVTGGFAHRAYAVRRGQRGHVREHAAGTFEHIYLPFVSEAIPGAAFSGNAA